LQVVTSQTNGSHAVTVAGEQVPAPSQVCALVCKPALHDAVAPHEVPGAALAQLWLAAQRPVLPQAPLGMQAPCGSATPVPTKVQVPALPVTLQDWQSGQAVPPVLQQTPSTQWPAPHWTSALHEAPIPPVLWHMPALSQ